MADDQARQPARTEPLAQLREAQARIRELERELEGCSGAPGRALQAENARLRDLIEHTSDWIWEVDRDGRYTYVSGKVRSLLGYEPEELLGRRPFDIMAEGEAERLAALFEEAARDRTALVGIVNTLRHRSGHEVVVETSGVPITGERGELAGYRGIDRDVSEIERIDAELRRSRDLLQRLMSVIPDMVSVHDRSFDIVFSNWRGFGAVPEDRRRTGTKCYRTYRGFEEVCPDCRAKDVLATGRPFGEDVELPDGTWVDLRILPVFDARREVELVVEWVRDITKAKRIEQELAAQRRRYQRMLDTIPDLVYELASDGTVVYANQVAADLLGWPLDRLGEIRIDELLAPDDLARALETVQQQASAGGRVRGQRYRLRTRDGASIEVEANSTLLEHEGLPPTVLGIARDVRDRSRAEEAYRTLADNPLQGIAIFQDDRVVFANDALARIVGVSLGGIIDAGPAAVQACVHPEDRVLVWERMQRRIRGEEVVQNYEYRIVRPDGEERWVEIFASRVHFGGRPAVQVLYHDITAAKRAAEERRALEDQLRQSQKMEAIGRLAGGIAHDFNNVLTAITGYADMLKSALAAGDPLRDDACEIGRAAERAARLTDQLLAFSRKQLIAPKVIALDQVIANAERMLARIIGEDVALSVERVPGLWTIRADPTQIDQVLVNLAANARDAMPRGGSLTIATANVDVDEAYARTRPDAQPGAYVELRVADDGEGMDQQTLAQVFEPFFSTKGSEGTGLGLATVYGIVRQNGGFIEVESAPGQGARFRVFFPRAGAPPQPLSVPDTAGGLPRGGETILLVEDEAIVRRLARRVLERLGYAVLEAADADEALLACERHEGGIDLLLTDVVMPTLNGRELAQQLEARRPGMPALFMTGYAESAIARHGVLEEGTHLIRKPFTVEALARKVRSVLDERCRARLPG